MCFKNLSSVPAYELRMRILIGSHGSTYALSMVPKEYLLELPGAMCSFGDEHLPVRFECECPQIKQFVMQ